MGVKPFNIFRKSLGLNNVADPSKIQIADRGVTEFSLAYNIDIDQNGRVSLRKGYVTTARTESCHSLWAGKNDCFFVNGTSLYRLNLDMTRTGVRSGLTSGARMAFVEANFMTYYCNGFENGYISGNTSYVWSAGTYSGPPTTKVFSSAPVGTHLEVFNGRMFIAKGKQLFYSEPFAYNWYNLASSYIWFSHDLIFVRAVLGGLYVGTTEEVYFLSGNDPEEFSIITIAPTPAIEWTDLTVDGNIFGDDPEGKVAMWTATDGIWRGMVGGKAENLTLKKLVYPSAQYGCGVAFDDKYVVLLQE